MRVIGHSVRAAGARAAIAVLLLAVLSSVAGCTSRPATPTGFILEYQTGSIPPPFNNTYRIDGTFVDGGLDVHYRLTYRFREGMSEAELRDDGYSLDDDLDWTGRLDGDEASVWRDLVGRSRVDVPSPPPPGSDTMTLTIRDAGGERTGTPGNDAEWRALAADLDRQAREELGHPRAEP